MSVLSDAKLLKLAETVKIKKDPSSLGKIRSLLKNDHSSAIGCLLAVEALIGPIKDWEPETIWLSLDGIDLSHITRAKILAAITVRDGSAFYWDATVFENISVVFNHNQNYPDILHDVHPAHLAWAIYESQLIRSRAGEQIPEFQHEPVSYSAVSLF